MIQHSLLSAAGQALYGKKWKRDVAKLCSVNERTVGRWAKGSNPVPWSALARLLTETNRRMGELDSLAGELAHAAYGGGGGDDDE